MKTYRYFDGEFEVRIEIKRSIFIATVKGELNADRIQVISLISLTLIQEPDSTKSPILSIGYNNPVVQTLVPLIVNYTTLCNSTMPVPSANMK